MIEWIIKNKLVILFGIIGLIAGFLLNRFANRLSENRIIAAITAQIQALQNKGARMTAGEQTKLIELKAKLELLKIKR